jgi:putative phage-type endonuclease
MIQMKKLKYKHIERKKERKKKRKKTTNIMIEEIQEKKEEIQEEEIQEKKEEIQEEEIQEDDENDVQNIIQFILILLDEKEMEKDEIIDVLHEMFIDEDNLDIYIQFALDIYSIYNEQVDIKQQVQQVDIKQIERQILFLRFQFQPPQRTLEWYLFRYNMITASNAWKALGSQCSINNLICEKCQPLKQEDDDSNKKMTNVNSPMHWGQKYEPISVDIYENKYQTKIELFGCIRHPQYSFLGASPDGINVDSSSPLFGRMLEIKNVVSREITGIPKNDYWIQMQLQMEVCDLNICDFLETKFIEYENKMEYEKDETLNLKGYFMFFIDSFLVPHYIYKPIDLTDPILIKEWDKQTFQTYTSSPFYWKWAKRCYWKLEKLSCIVVERDKLWFQQNISKISAVWDIIVKERISGEYISRLPNKKMKVDKKTKSELNQEKKQEQEQSSLGLLLTIE